MFNNSKWNYKKILAIKSCFFDMSLINGLFVLHICLWIFDYKWSMITNIKLGSTAVFSTVTTCVTNEVVALKPKEIK